MYRLLLKILLPLCLLGGSACLDVPELEPPGTQQPTDRFSLSIDPGQATLLQGGSRSLQLSLGRAEGFTDSVTVQLNNPPAGISAQPVTLSAGSSSATWSISASGSAEPGPKTLTVRGTAGTLFRDMPVTLTVARQGDLVVQWASPSQSKMYVKDSIPVQVVVEGGTAESIDLYKGTDLLTRLVGPSYQYTWDTSQEAEGEYPLTARATMGGNTFNSTIRTIVVDRTAPTVAARTPAHGTMSVSVRDTLQVSFDEALKASSVTEASVVLSTAGAPNIAKTLSLSADGKTLTISPTAPLSLPADVTITLGTPTAPLTDLAGNALAPASAWSFTVPSWLPLGGAISAVGGNTPAENVAMKVGTDGNPVIAWSEPDGATKNIHVRQWTGTNWIDIGTAMSAVPDTGTHAEMPALALDASNHPIVVWQELTTSTGPTNLYGRWWNGTTWQTLPAFPAAVDPDKRLYEPSITFDGTGAPVVAATFYTGVSFELRTFNLYNGSWSNASPPRPSDQIGLGNPALTTDSSGNWLIAYDANSESQGTRSIAIQKRISSGYWSQLGSTIMGPAKTTNHAASIALSGAGIPYVVWREGSDWDSSDGALYAASWNEPTWRMLGTTISTNTTHNSTPVLIMGGDGLPLVAWSGYAAPETSIWVSRWNGSTWQQVGSRLSAATGVSTSGFRPVLALDKNGQPLVAWHESDSAVSNVYVYRYNY